MRGFELYEISEKWITNKVKDGYVKRINLSSELDSVTIVVENTNKITNIEKFDVVGFKEEYLEKDVIYIVGQFSEDISVNTSSETLYTYTIDLVSPTKLFELITLPCATHTNVLGDKGKTVGQYLTEQLEYYCAAQMTGVELGDVRIVLDLPYGLYDMICPEFALGECTMRELIDYFMSMKNCIFTCNIETVGNDIDYSYIITYIDYNKRGNPIYNEDMIITRSDSIDNAASHLRTTLTNTIQKNSIVEKQVVKCEGAIITTADYKLILNNPIYDLESVYVTLQITRYATRFTQTGTGELLAVETKPCLFETTWDISKYVVPKNIYETLPIHKPSPDTPIPDDCRNCHIFWEREKNTIDGIMQQYSGYFNYEDKPAISVIIEKVCKQENDGPFEWRLLSGGNPNTTWIAAGGYNDMGFAWSDKNGNYGDEPDFSDDPGEFYFTVKYKSYTPSAMIVEQSTPFKRKSVLFNNQTDALVNVEKFTVQSIEKVNQLGNEQITFVGRTSKYSRVPKLGDYYNDYTVTNVVLSYANKQFEYKGFMVKNFVNTSLYSFLNKQKRYTSLVDASEAVTRHEVVLRYVKISCSDNPQTYNYGIPSRIALCSFDFNESGYLFYDNKKLLMPVNTQFEGNMIRYTINFPDNIVAGRKRDTNVIGGTDLYPMIEVSYTDDKGEFRGVKVQYYAAHEIDYYEDFNNIKYALAMLPESTSVEAIDGSDRTGGYNEILYNYFNFRKDNRERIILTTQLQFYTEDENIIVGNNFSKIFTSNIKIYAGTKKITYMDQIVNTSEFYPIPNSSYTFENFNSLKIDNYIEHGRNIVVVSENNELLLAIKNYDGKYINFGRHSNRDSTVFINKLSDLETS